ncbi:MAG: flagellar hook-basal body complex protein [Rhodospirillales bacterium]
MSLFGALTSGVSGLSAQSSAMGAIADNVTNVNTIGYKSTNVQFQTLVTAQVSLTQYSPGGVQSSPQTGVDVQGLLQASTSATDVAISGQGFFVVNEAAEPGVGDLFAYTRAGSFGVDSDGFLQNVSGWYLQGWPLQPAGNSTTGFATVTVGADTFVKAYQDTDGTTVAINDNIVSRDDLRPINLNTIGGTAQETTAIRLGANLPAGADVGDDHKANVVIFDTLGNSHNLELVFDKQSENAWGAALEAPEGSATIELHGTDDTDSTPDVFAAAGIIEFTGVPSDGEQIIIDGITFEFDTDSTVTETETLRQVDISASTVTETTDVTPILKTAIDNSNLKETSRFVASGSNIAITQSIMGDAISVDVSNILTVRQVAANDDAGTFTVEEIDFAYKNGARLDFLNDIAQASSSNDFVVTGSNTITGDAGTFDNFAVGDVVVLTNSDTSANDLKVVISAVATNGSSITVGTTAGVHGTASTTPLTNDAADATMTVTRSYDGEQITIQTGTSTSQIFEMRDGELTPQATSTNQFTVAGTAGASPTITATTVGTFHGLRPGDSVVITNGSGANNQTVSIGAVNAAGTQITVTGAGAVSMDTDGADSDMTITFNDTAGTDYVEIPSTADNADVAEAVADAIQANANITTPNRFDNDGTSLVFEQSSIGTDVDITISDVTMVSGAYSATTTDGSGNTILAGTESTASSATQFTLIESDFGAKKAAISFNGDGTPAEINVNNVDIQWSNGASDQEFVNATSDERVSLFLGNTNVADGMTQFAGDYQINFISQNGAQFGNFAGVSIGGDGIVSALFDNGVTRPVFQIPVATFVNPNELETLSGNVYIETDLSGQPTVREAGEGGAGQLAGAALESSTVDIGEEFTSMIVTQRAFSAAAKIITTADEMLEELLRTR